jgi:putative endonuclease
VSFALIRKRLRSLSWPARHRDPRLLLGRRGERAAARFLKRHGYRVLARNYHRLAGEIDLICAHADTIVFVEVKTRSSDEAQEPLEALRPAQQRRIEQAARCFLMERSAQDRACRFDVVTIVWQDDGSRRVEHFEDAFRPRQA